MPDTNQDEQRILMWGFVTKSGVILRNCLSDNVHDATKKMLRSFCEDTLEGAEKRGFFLERIECKMSVIR